MFEDIYCKCLDVKKHPLIDERSGQKIYICKDCYNFFINYIKINMNED